MTVAAVVPFAYRGGAVLDLKYPEVTCPRCNHKTCGRLYKDRTLRICAGCAAGKNLKRAR